MKRKVKTSTAVRPKAGAGTHIRRAVAVLLAALMMIPLATSPSAAASTTWQEKNANPTFSWEGTYLNPAGKTCYGYDVTLYSNGHIYGTPERDVIMGSIHGQYIFGVDGNDIICGMGGKDTIFGGSGDDAIFGHSPGTVEKVATEIPSQFANPHLNATFVAKLYGQDGNDLIYGSGMLDDIEGGNGHDYMFGGGRGDRLDGGDGLDFFHGGGGDDVCYDFNQDLTGQAASSTTCEFHTLASMSPLFNCWVHFR